jgi:hypothetical protein
MLLLDFEKNIHLILHILVATIEQVAIYEFGLENECFLLQIHCEIM